MSSVAGSAIPFIITRDLFSLSTVPQSLSELIVFFLKHKDTGIQLDAGNALLEYISNRKIPNELDSEIMFSLLYYGMNDAEGEVILKFIVVSKFESSDYTIVNSNERFGWIFTSYSIIIFI